ncbi:MAG TPA: phytanoyl-CoA dioxygenase family protein [Roseiflexaceae bacterium]|nr:phytanoyl-CoA dioxygenase family protein [Roseiflexaceae bacterium]HMP40079.1 phytanoyl-CoA dioxygenase family protein [Roseiflexaceae bacterium]
MADQHAVQQFRDTGYTVVRGLFSAEEVAHYREHFMQLRESSSYPGDFGGTDLTSSDPLKRYPRMIHMHRWDALSLNWMIDERLARAMSALLGKEPFAVQTMLYFKPPGARGQALHQDQYFLKVQPGTCIAAWLALDDCDEENGCLQVVPNSHNLPLLCTVKADLTQSFTDITVPLPEGMQPEPVIMQAGDVLFFNGQVIHGSFPNVTTDRFRRALIGHYIVGDARQVAQFYHPALRMDGSPVELGVSQGGSECGVWVDIDGEPSVAMRPIETAVAGPAHE